MDSSSAVSAEVTKTPARVGQLVLSLGRPSSNGIEASLGTVSAINGPVRTGRGGMLEKYIRTDTISFPGFSGGPLVSADGSILGINTSGLAHGTGLTIPADVAWKVADTLAKHGHIKRGYLGIRSQTVEIPAAAQKSLKREQATGLLVMGVEKDSPATKADLMVGDILVGIAGAAIEHHDELFARLSGDVVGKSTPIDVIRGGELKTVNVVIGER
jgi:S1-C subfamily serine protease